MNMNGPSSRDVSRRIVNFLLGVTGIGAAASILYPVLQFLVPPRIAESAQSSVVAGKASALAPNSGAIFRFGPKPGIVIRTPGGEIRAFSAVCTHLQCTVQYRPDLEHIWWACHNGHYDLHGINIAGPPPRPLEPYAVHIRGDEIVVTRS